MSKMFLPLAILLLVTYQIGVDAQLTIKVKTWNLATDGCPNTFIGTGADIASSLLAGSIPVILWGVVSSSDVNAVCQQIVNTGNLNFNATVTATTGTTHTLSLEITAIGGCLAAADGSGTEAVMVDNDSRKSAIVCPDDAGSKGCGLYLTGDDINEIYHEGSNIRRLLSSKRLLGDEYAGKARLGVISGSITGEVTLAECKKMGPLAVFCAVGLLGACMTEAGAGGGAGCFPGDATVLLSTGETKYMTALALGDKVAVRKHDGAVAFEEIYAFGHKDASTSAHYIQVSMKPSGANFSDPAVESRVLELTAGHFAQVSSGPKGKISYKRGKDVAVGDLMWAQSTHSEKSISSYVVTSITTVEKTGLYNPFTISGDIIVNGVAASTHSDWFLENTFDLLNLTHKLPSAYQTILSPVRMMYYVLGNKAYFTLYHQLDGLIDVAKFGTIYGGHLASMLITSSIGVAVLISKLSTSRKA